MVRLVVRGPSFPPDLPRRRSSSNFPPGDHSIPLTPSVAPGRTRPVPQPLGRAAPRSGVCSLDSAGLLPACRLQAFARRINVQGRRGHGRDQGARVAGSRAGARHQGGLALLRRRAHAGGDRRPAARVARQGHPPDRHAPSAPAWSRSSSRGRLPSAWRSRTGCASASASPSAPWRRRPRTAPLPLATLAAAGAHSSTACWSRTRPRPIGIGHGRTLAGVVEQPAAHARPGVRFVSLLGSLTRHAAANPFDVIHKLAEITGAESYFMPAPFFADSIEDKRVLLGQKRPARRVRAGARGRALSSSASARSGPRRTS